MDSRSSLFTLRWSLLLVFLLILTSCQKGNRLQGSATGEVTPIPDPCDLAPDTEYPLQYPLTLLVVSAGEVIDPLIPLLPSGDVCLPGDFTIDPPLPEGMALNSANGRIYGSPRWADSQTTHAISAIFPQASVTTTLHILVPPAPPAFEYPVHQVELEPLEQFWMTPILLPGSGPVQLWSSPSDDTPIGAFQLNPENGTVTLHGVGNYLVTVVGQNDEGEDVFTIIVETVTP